MQVQGDAFSALDKRSDDTKKLLHSTVPRVQALEEGATASAADMQQWRAEAQAQLAAAKAAAEESVEMGKFGAPPFVHILVSTHPWH